MRVAIVHDWLTGMRGGEKVLEQLCLLYPEATIFTLLHLPRRVSPAINRMAIVTSPLQRLPAARSRYRWYLPLFPHWVEGFDLAGYDLVVSSSHCCALGAKAAPGALHVCYCHTPMRYAREHFDLYFPAERYGRAMRAVIAWQMARLRRWEVGAASRVDAFIANSRNVAGRIQAHFARSARIVYPPVDTDFFTPSGVRREDFYLIVSALVPYKRLDLAVSAFTRLGMPLQIIGRGPERARLEQIAGPSVRFLGWCSDEAVREAYRRARALVMPGEEDLGLTPLEAAACGTPTIALGRGGALETVDHGVTGVRFEEPTVAGLERAVAERERSRFDPVALREHAVAFSPERFQAQLRAAVNELS